MGPYDYSSGNGFLQGLSGAGMYQQIQQSKLEMENAQRQQEEERVFQAGWKSSFGDPQKMMALAAENPKMMDRIKTGIGFKDEQHQMALGNAARDLRVATATGNPAAIYQAAEKHQATLQSIGSSAEDVTQQFVNNPQALASTIDAVGMSALGAKDYYGVQNDRAQQQVAMRGQDVAAETARRGQDLSHSSQMARLNHDKYVYKQSQAQIARAGAANDMDTLELNAQILSTGIDPLTGKAATSTRIKQAGKWMDGNNKYNESLITGQRGIDKADSLLDKSDLEGIGRAAGRNPDIFTSADGLANRNAIEELKSGAFVQNVQAMRGLGALSNAEGQKLQNLIARLDPTQPEDVVRKQLDEIKTQYSVLQSVYTKEAGLMGYSSSGYDTYVSELKAKKDQGAGGGNQATQQPATQPQQQPGGGSYTSKSGIQFTVK